MSDGGPQISMPVTFGAHLTKRGSQREPRSRGPSGRSGGAFRPPASMYNSAVPRHCPQAAAGQVRGRPTAPWPDGVDEGPHLKVLVAVRKGQGGLLEHLRVRVDLLPAVAPGHGNR